MNEVIYHPIGVVENDSVDAGSPKQMRNAPSRLILDKKYIPALQGLELFKYALVVYHLHKSQGYREKVHPMGDISIPMRGVLATRSPFRPNPLAVTLVKILNVSENVVLVCGLDALHGTPVLDIKPYEEHFDSPQGIEWEKDPDYRPEDIMGKRSCEQKPK